VIASASKSPSVMAGKGSRPKAAIELLVTAGPLQGLSAKRSARRSGRSRRAATRQHPRPGSRR
jgi:hypothetical protein